MDRITSMATFVKVVETGGFSAAARAVNMSPSMVTTHIQALEERLGVRLLNRSTRKVGLTEVGQAYFERCVQILAELDDADQIVQALQSTPRGTLRLNTSIVMPPFIAPVISEFVELYPDAGVEMIISDRMVDLVEEGYDIAIRVNPDPDDQLVGRAFCTISCCWWARRHSPSATRDRCRRRPEHSWRRANGLRCGRLAHFE